MAGQYNIYLSTAEEEALIDFMAQNFNIRGSISDLLKLLIGALDKLTVKTENGK